MFTTGYDLPLNYVIRGNEIYSIVNLNDKSISSTDRLKGLMKLLTKYREIEKRLHLKTFIKMYATLSDPDYEVTVISETAGTVTLKVTHKGVIRNPKLDHEIRNLDKIEYALSKALPDCVTDTKSREILINLIEEYGHMKYSEGSDDAERNFNENN